MNDKTILIEIARKFMKKYKWLPVMQIITAMGITGFWIYFFILENTPSANNEIYLAYERSFPLPDILWVNILLFLSAFWLRKENPRGIISTIAAGGALVFLGLVDFSFNFQQGIYAKSLVDGVMNGFINSFCLFFGLVSIFIGWKLFISFKTSENPNEI